MTPRTAQSNRTFHKLLNQLYPAKLREEMKETIVCEHTKGRTTHSSDMWEDEMKEAISAMQKALTQTTVSVELSPNMRKLFALRKSLNWSYAHLSDFIKTHTHGAKHHTRQLTSQEVNTLVSVMEKIEASNHRKSQRQ